MTKNSPAYILSLFSNIKKIVNGEDIDIDLLANSFQFNKSKDFLKKNYLRIFNEIENSYYSIYDLKITLLYEMLFKNSFQHNAINKDSVRNCMKLFSKDQFLKDKEYIISLLVKLELKEIADFFVLDNSGKTIIFYLVKEKIISPIIWIRFLNMFNSVFQEYSESEDHKRFKLVMGLIKNQLIS